MRAKRDDDVSEPQIVRSSKDYKLEDMSIDELWVLHEAITNLLSVRITSEKMELEKRLAALDRGKASSIGNMGQSHPEVKQRRKYPRVFPKYRNPGSLSETWSGRGKQPRWLVAAIKAGRKIEDFRIKEPGRSKNGR